MILYSRNTGPVSAQGFFTPRRGGGGGGAEQGNLVTRGNIHDIMLYSPFSRESGGKAFSWRNFPQAPVAPPLHRARENEGWEMVPNQYQSNEFIKVMVLTHLQTVA